ncbi:MAG: SprT-like domain-containing protein [Clostridia bacterium]|nr:SprT-like domain-containing protein [Clostridia bacterium]
MKQVTNMSRLVNQLEKTFKLLNHDFFDDELPMPIITVIPSSKSYAHYVPFNIWSDGDKGKREINIASGTLDRPLENIIASLQHEMCHMLNDVVLNVADTSRSGTYHNKYFKRTAEQKGLIVTRSDKYGFAHTAPADSLIEWVLEHDELREIEICRMNTSPAAVGVGVNTGNGRIVTTTGANPNSHSRKYICLHCKQSVRATKAVNIICADCMQAMIEC